MQIRRFGDQRHIVGDEEVARIDDEFVLVVKLTDDDDESKALIKEMIDCLPSEEGVIVRVFPNDVVAHLDWMVDEGDEDLAMAAAKDLIKSYGGFVEMLQSWLSAHMANVENDDDDDEDDDEDEDEDDDEDEDEDEDEGEESDRDDERAWCSTHKAYCLTTLDPVDHDPKAVAAP